MQPIPKIFIQKIAKCIEHSVTTKNFKTFSWFKGDEAVMKHYPENNLAIPLLPGACLRVAASAKAGERAGVRGKHIMSPPPAPSPVID